MPAMKPAGYAVDNVRNIAKCFKYEEIDFNETSKMISFRKGTTRINVYYTTGTVGTCLNHPKRGKTQLFRGNVPFDRLVLIFADPRVHTGGGYYRKYSTQQWKLDRGECGDASFSDRPSFLCDSARRWVYVGVATGLLRTDRERQVVTEICTEWDSLYWDTGNVPSLGQTNYYCGSHGGLMDMLWEVAQEITHDPYVMSCNYKEFQRYEAGEISSDMIELERPYDHDCYNKACFLEDHEDDVHRIKQKFRSLRKDVRIELMSWFLGRDAVGQIFVSSDYEEIKTSFSNAIHDAHLEYGEMMYPKKAGLCNHCGVLEQ